MESWLKAGKIVQFGDRGARREDGRLYGFSSIFGSQKNKERTYSLFVNIVKSFCNWYLKRSSPNK